MEIPELQIVSHKLWDAVHRRLDTKRTLPPRMRRAPRRLLSGILQCGVCGGSMTIIGEGRLGCSSHKERGTCSNNKKISAARAENAVLQGIKVQMLQPEIIREFANAFKQRLADLSHTLTSTREKNEQQFADVEKQISRILDSMQAARPLPSLVNRLKQLEATQAQISAQKPLDRSPPFASLPSPDLAELYRKKIDKLHECLTRDQLTRVKAATQIRTLINKVEVHPIEPKGAARLKITGDMSAVVGLTGGKRKNRCTGGSGGGNRTPDTRIMIPLL